MFKNRIYIIFFFILVCFVFTFLLSYKQNSTHIEIFDNITFEQYSELNIISSKITSILDYDYYKTNLVSLDKNINSIFYVSNNLNLNYSVVLNQYDKNKNLIDTIEFEIDDTNTSVFDTNLYGEPIFLEKSTKYVNFVIKNKKNNTIDINNIAFIGIKDESLYKTNFDFVLASENPRIILRNEWGANDDLLLYDNWIKERNNYCERIPWACLPPNAQTLERMAKIRDELKEKYPEDVTPLYVKYNDDNGNKLSWSRGYSDIIKKIVIHHTAGAIDDLKGDKGYYTLEDCKAKVRAIYTYHSIARGWGDIGYHYLIDPLGNIYEGKSGGDFVVGGHVSYKNVRTIGISLIGNFQNDIATSPSIHSLTLLIAYLSEKYDLNPNGKNNFLGQEQHVVLGHRDLQATACPGENLYKLLPTIRQRAFDKMNNFGGNIKNDITYQPPEIFDYEFLYINLQPLQYVFIGEQIPASIGLKNTGNTVWQKTGENAIKLKPINRSCQNSFANSNCTLGYLKENEVKPGEVGHFDIILNPKNNMRFLVTEKFAPCIEGIVCMEDKGLEFSLYVFDPSSDVYYRFIQSNLSQTYLDFGQSNFISIELKNNDIREWKNINGFDRFMVFGDINTNDIKNISFSKDNVKIGESTYLNIELMPISQKHQLKGNLVFFNQDNQRLFGPNIELSFNMKDIDLGAEIIGNKRREIKINNSDYLEVELQYRNTGKVIWEKGIVNLGKFSNREKPSELYHNTWENNLRPVTLLEDKVYPGEIGTFKFLIKPNRYGTIVEDFKPGYFGVGWLNVDSIALSVSNIANTNISNYNHRLANLYNNKDIKIRLSYPRDKNYVSLSPFTGNYDVYFTGNKFTLNSNDEITIEKNDDKFKIYYKGNNYNANNVLFLGSDKTVLEVTSWTRIPNWDTNSRYNDNKFRGNIGIIVEDNRILLINELSMEAYLKGLAETGPNDHYEKRKVLAVIARTYALFYMQDHERKFSYTIYYDGCDDPNVFQKYLGYEYEIRAPKGWLEAVKNTSGEVVVFKNELIKTPYFTQSDGRTRSGQEVWGWTNTPYLISVPDPYCEGETRLGHGVGVSALGAQKMAEYDNKKYDEIIKYYYTGVSLLNLNK